MTLLSNIQQNLTCVHQRYSPRLTIRYWCPAESISNHIQTDIPQIPSVFCWSTEKYHLQKNNQWKFVSSSTARFSTTENTVKSTILQVKICVFKHCKIFQLWHLHFNSEILISKTVQNHQLRIDFYNFLQISSEKVSELAITVKFVELKEVFTRLSL